ncbi:DUF397 domain-containing protein [Streptomyces reniochalinae]|uniref:DUF397 domain-containing protein n=1 Tax=Streptomyces reniochalinae TaxID=2250578 RepID=A0A367EC60_9ACTN|nr:DUF397 domain-containing protein [Streptomyces reniochalinae]RCG15255.1 DUF397 domain-containing protein [Streptomyces reniochalinae]
MTSAASPANRTWRKSSYSANNGGNCLEVADGHTGARLPVRDSKDPHGPVLLFGNRAWTAFLSHVHDEQADDR